MATFATCSHFSRQSVSHILCNITKRSTFITITHRYFCSNTQTQSISSDPLKPKIPILKREYDKDSKTLSYILTTQNNEISKDIKLSESNSNKTTIIPSDKELKKTQNNNKRLATNALTEYLPSHKTDKQRDREKELKSLEQSLLRKFGAKKEKLLKELKKKSIKQQHELSKEIMSYFQTIPKLEKLRNKLSNDDLSKLLLLQQALQISPKQYQKVLKRYPYILKMDIESEIIPKIRSLQEVFPNQDTLSIFIRTPNIIASNTSTWLTRRDKINNLLGIRKDIFVNVISKQPSILFNSIIKTTGPKIRFLCDRVRNKLELQSLLIYQPSILKVGWGRLARIEFLRSPSVPHQWQNECINPPPNTVNNPLDDNDGNDDDLQDLNDGKIVDNKTLKMRKLKQKEREMNMEWHLNRPCVTWNHHQMKHNYPKYIKFLEEFTLRAKKSKMWTKKDLIKITTKEMEEIIGNALRKKYIKRKLIGVNWEKKELKKKQNNRLKKIRKRMAQQTPIEKQTF